MDAHTKKKIYHKRKRPKETTDGSKAKTYSTYVNACENTVTPENTVNPDIQLLHEPEVQQVHSVSHNEVSQEESPISDSNQVKKTRGLTKMKDIAVDPGNRIHVEFTSKGEPCGNGSVKLSSYLGPLVREHVHVTLHDWRKLSDDKKIVLWKIIQVSLLVIIWF